MNIFVTSQDPVVAARNLGFHVRLQNKMILESAQLLFTAASRHGLGVPYKATHINHPSAIWTACCYDNWYWVYEHIRELNVCYRQRSNKDHKSWIAVSDWFEENRTALYHFMKNNKGVTLPYLAMPDTFQKRYGRSVYLASGKIGYQANSWEAAEQAYQDYLETKEYAKGCQLPWQKNLENKNNEKNNTKRLS